MPEKKYYLAQIIMKGDTINPMFVIYGGNFKRIFNLIKNEPMFGFEEKEISKEEFKKLEEKLRGI